MSTRDVIDEYYKLASSGDWSSWLKLFAPDLVMDEQMAGHVEGRQVLEKLISAFPKVYQSFRNAPFYTVIDGEEAAVFSHISAVLANGDPVEVDAANYFVIANERISYLSNVHDTVPFKSVPAHE
jgi:ketosteroid isomerase-like protein